MNKILIEQILIHLVKKSVGLHELAIVNKRDRETGRHERTGRPFKDTLEKLGLEEFYEWAQLD